MKLNELYAYIQQTQPNICQISVLQNGQGIWSGEWNEYRKTDCTHIRAHERDDKSALGRIMSKRRIIILIAVFALLSLAVSAVLCFAKIHPPKDRIADLNYPPEFICDSDENRIGFQTGDNCAAYATAFVLRSLGEETDGGQIAPEIKRLFGFVSAGSIVRVFEKHGFSAKAYHGDVDTLKHRLVGGVPVIVFLSIPNDTHYAVVVGYDTQYFYLVDSLPENKNADGIQYNRKLTIEEFEKVWKTDTVLPDNIYIVVNHPDGDTVRKTKVTGEKYGY